jgi:tetratricopeptide (TPR) repeat protein
MTTSDATRLAGDAYSTRLVRDVTVTSDQQTRLAQQGYLSKLARDAVGVQPDADELYKIGDKIGDRYEVAAIHHGAMGVVYGCFDHQTKLPRALKTVRARYAHDKQVLSMFESEAAVWISLEKHPYIVRAYLVERFKNLPYVITEYVRGPEGMEGDMRGWLGHPRLTLPVAVAMALQIAQGMQHAVRKVPNLVHRDLKPANILVNVDGKAMVTDFGLVQSAQSNAGTPAYMSPEQWRGEALDARSDIYAYGCILFEMFTARRLFPALTEREWERAHLDSAPAALIGLVSDLPGEIEQFVRCCLEKKVESRPRSWDEVVAFFAEWYHRLTGKAVVFDFSSLALNSSELFDAGYSLHKLMRFEKAIEAYDQALVINPKDSAAWYCKGVTLNCLNRSEDAVKAYDQALAIDPNRSDAWYNKGSALFNLHRYELAIQAYDQAIAIDPSDSDTWFNKGLALKNLNCNDDALKAYDQSLSIDPNKSAAWYNKGSALINLHRYEQAIQACDQALAIDLNNSNLWINKGVALKNLDRYDEAIQAYDRALSIDPNNYAAWSNKGLALSGFHRNDEAVKAYDQALAIDPNKSEAWYNKGLALIKLHRYEEAILANDQVLAIDQNNSTACYSKGCALHHLNRYEEAIRAYDRALSIDPNSYAGWSNKGLALNGLNRNDEAIKAYDQALAIDPNRSDAWVNKGYALNTLRRYEEAIQSFDKVIAIDPKNAYASSGKAHAIAQTHEIDRSCVDSRNAKNIVTNKLEQHAITPKEHQPRSFWGRLFGK